MRDAQENVEAPRRSFSESRHLRKFLRYMALMRNIIDSKTSSYEEATHQQVWKDAIVEEYTSMKNDV